MNGIVLAWAVEAGIVTWRAFKRDSRAPLPSEFVATFVIFGTLGVIAESPTARPACTVTAWGIVIATALNLGPATHLSPSGGETSTDGTPVKIQPVSVAPVQAK